MSSTTKEVALIVGASRGIGRQVAIDLARAGYAVVVAAKSTSSPDPSTPFPPDPNSSASTITTVAREIKEAGGEATPIPVDTRSYSSIQSLIAQTISTYGRLDVLIYNSGAIWWASVEKTPMKRFQLMQQVNVEGLYGVIQEALPHFKQKDGTSKGRIIVVSPPIYSRFFRGKTAYAMGKVGMSVLTKGLAMDFEREGKKDMAISSIWPAVAIQSAATASVASDDEKDLRHATIYSDAILEMIRAPVAEVNGELVLDEDFLRSRGVKDFGKYSLVKGSVPRRIMPMVLPDLRVQEQGDEGKRVDSTVLRGAKL